MSIRVFGRVLVDAPRARDRFEGIREVTGLVAHGADDAPRDGREWVRRMRIRCRTGERLRGGGDCVSCRRFVNYKPSPANHSVIVRCRWTDEDLVSDMMTPACAVVTVPRDATMAEARSHARVRDVDHVVVSDHGGLGGVLTVSASDAACADDPVWRHMSRRLWIIPPRATIADVVVIVRSYGVDCLPVVDGGVLRGLITRAHLVRSGIGHAIAV